MQQTADPRSSASDYKTASVNSFAASIDGVPVNGATLSLPPGVSIVMDPSEPEQIKQAVRDLQRDLLAVLGQESPVVSTIPAAGTPAIIVAYQGTATLSFKDPTLTEPENHQVSVQSFASTNYAVLQGSDIRGTIYAIYTFSDKFLNVPPLWYWSNWQPTRVSSVVIAQNQGIRVGTPQTKYRAWFLNNQDMWLDWNPTPDKYAILYETMLRLKLNTYFIGPGLGELGGSAFDRALNAQNRGLIVASSTLTTFGHWEEYWTQIKHVTPPALTLANQAKYEEYWAYSIQFAKDKGLDVLWVLGFRGLGDNGFWDDMPDSPTAPIERGDIIETQVKRQAALVRKVSEEQHPKMAFLIWNELADLMEKSALQPPVDTDLIWTFGNDIRDHFPPLSARTYSLPSTQPYGLYMNLQFYSTGAHLAEAEGPWKAWKNYSIMQSRKASGGLDFAFLNMGNVREFLLTGAAGAEMFWNITNYVPDTQFQKQLSRYFGTDKGQQLLTYYKSYLSGYWTQHGSTISGFDRQYVFQDLRIKYALEKQLAMIRAKDTKLNFDSSNRLSIDYKYTRQNSEVGAIMKGSQESQNKFTTLLSSLETYAPTLPAQIRPFFIDTFIVPTQFLKEANKILYNVTRAYYTLKDPNSASCYLQTARQSIAPMKAALTRGNHDQFSSWYNYEELFGITAIESDIAATQATLPGCSKVIPTATPTQKPTPTPTKAPVSLVSQAYGSTTGLKTSSIKDGKRTLLKINAATKISTLACYACGINTLISLYSSNSSGALGTKLVTGNTTSTTASWSSLSTSLTLTSGSYYVLEFTPAAVPVYFGTTAVSTADISYLKFATTGASTWKTGSWQVKLTYSK